MGNFIQKGKLNLNDFEQALQIEEAPGINFTVHKNKKNDEDLLLLKEISHVVQMIPADCQAEMLQRILTQSGFFSLLRFDQFRQNRQQQVVISTQITPRTLETEMLRLRTADEMVDAETAWAVLTNLLLAVMDMEHKLEFHQSISMKTVFFYPNGCISIINPYFKDSHIRSISKDIINPSLESGSWKPEFSTDYFARQSLVESNELMRKLQNIHQQHVGDMLKDVVFVVLGLLCHTPDRDFYDLGNSGRCRVDHHRVNSCFELLDALDFDQDLLDLLEFVLKYECDSCVELFQQLTPDQLLKALHALRHKEVLCPDTERAVEMLDALDLPNPYDQTLDLDQVSAALRIAAGPRSGLQPSEKKVRFENQPSKAPAPQTDSGLPAQLRDKLKAGLLQSNLRKPQAAPPNAGVQQAAQKLDKIKPFLQGGAKQNDSVMFLPAKLEKLREFDSSNTSLFSLRSGQQSVATEVSLLHRFMDQARPEPLFEKEALYSDHSTRDYSPPREPRVVEHVHHHPASCKHHQQLGQCSLSCHLHKPQYSPLAHMYYAGRPVTETEAALLHELPLSSK